MPLNLVQAVLRCFFTIGRLDGKRGGIPFRAATSVRWIPRRLFSMCLTCFLIVFLSKVQNAVRAKTTGSDQRSRLKNLKLQHFALFNENFEKLFRGRLRVHARNEAEGKKHCVPFLVATSSVATAENGRSNVRVPPSYPRPHLPP